MQGVEELCLSPGWSQRHFSAPVLASKAARKLFGWSGSKSSNTRSSTTMGETPGPCCETNGPKSCFHNSLPSRWSSAAIPDASGDIQQTYTRSPSTAGEQLAKLLSECLRNSDPLYSCCHATL